MEKFVVLIWKRQGASAAEFAAQLRSSVVDDLRSLGAERIRVSVEDEEVAAGEGLRIACVSPPKSGMVSMWCESSPIAAASTVITAMSARIAAYRVRESSPLVHDPVPSGTRTPGFSTVTCFAKRPDLTYDGFREIWYGEHEACAIETQSTFGYVRNEVVERITPEAPAWDASVEENFPIAALTDEQAFYDAIGDAESTSRNASRMFSTVQKFLDLSTVDRTACSEYDFD